MLCAKALFFSYTNVNSYRSLNNMLGSSSKARRRAREFALQALYQWQLNQTDLTSLERQYRERNSFIKHVDWLLFSDLIHQVPRNFSAINQTIEKTTDIVLTQIDPIELTTLRLATYELMHRLDIPYRVVIDEYVSLNKTFGATDGHKYINGVLDKLIPILRQHEHTS